MTPNGQMNLLSAQDIEVLKSALHEAIGVNFVQECDEPRQELRVPLRRNQERYRAVLQKLRIMLGLKKMEMTVIECGLDEDRLFAEEIADSIHNIFPVRE